MTRTCCVETDSGKVIDFERYLDEQIGWVLSSFPMPELRDDDMLPPGSYSGYDLDCLYCWRKENVTHDNPPTSRTPHLSLLLNIESNFREAFGLLVIEIVLHLMEEERTDVVTVRYE